MNFSFITNPIFLFIMFLSLFVNNFGLFINEEFLIFNSLLLFVMCIYQFFFHFFRFGLFYKLEYIYYIYIYLLLTISNLYKYLSIIFNSILLYFATIYNNFYDILKFNISSLIINIENKNIRFFNINLIFLFSISILHYIINNREIDIYDKSHVYDTFFFNVESNYSFINDLSDSKKSFVNKKPTN